jgi:transposase
MAMGKRRRHAKQASMWVATHDLPRSAAHPFYARLNQILDQHDFDDFVEGLCERFYADDGRPGLPPGRYFRLLLIGYFEAHAGHRGCAESVRTAGRTLDGRADESADFQTGCVRCSTRRPRRSTG